VEQEYCRADSVSNEDILELFKRIENGENAALAALYDQTSRLLFGLILKILGDRAVAETILLDVYTHIWKRLTVYDPRRLPLEWLIMTARTHAIARMHGNRQIWRKQPLPVSAEKTVAPERQKTACAMFDSLTPVQREILNWAYYSGMGLSEIAAQIGMPSGAVKTHARTGLSRLNDEPSNDPLNDTEARVSDAGSLMLNFDARIPESESQNIGNDPFYIPDYMPDVPIIEEPPPDPESYNPPDDLEPETQNSPKEEMP